MPAGVRAVVEVEPSKEISERISLLESEASVRTSLSPEATAVSEIFERLLDEIYNQKERNYAERYQLKQSYPTLSPKLYCNYTETTL